jgi:5'-3' exonuclease
MRGACLRGCRDSRGALRRADKPCGRAPLYFKDFPLKQLTIIDGNSVGHAAQHGLGKKGKLVAGGQETTAIFGMLQSMHRLMRARVSTEPVVLWDGRSWRYERFADYKGNRTATAEQVAERERYRSQRKYMFEGLHYLGVKQLIAGNMEADDLAAILSRQTVARGNMVSLITGDKDWLQIVQPGVAWLDHKLDRKCTVDNFTEFTGYRTRTAFVHSKALQGDAGDNVVTRIGIGEKGALELLAAFDDVHQFLGMDLDEATLRMGKKLNKKYTDFHGSRELRDRFEWALELMDLNHPKIPVPVGIKATREPINRPALEQFCMRLGMSGLLRGLDTFIKPFEQMEEFHA